jgi:intein/homing endonuclease
MPAKRKELKIEGANLWYLVGLITSDGCLSKDDRHINITSKDYEFLQELKDSLGLLNKIGTKNKDRVNRAYYLEFSNKNLYEFLLSIGLMPNKSLSLKSLKISEEFFSDFLRGLIDGDGCIRSWPHPTNFRQQWSLRIYSGSRIFLEWLDGKIREYIKVCGRIYKQNERSSVFVLKFGKMAAKEIARNCYYKNCFGLDRKIKLAQECMHSYAGWSKSKTTIPFCS